MVHASFADYTAIAEWLETWLPDATFIFKEGFTFVTGDDPVDGWPSMPVPGGARLDQSSRRSNTYEPQFSTEVKMISLAIHRHLLDLATLLDTPWHSMQALRRSMLRLEGKLQFKEGECQVLPARWAKPGRHQWREPATKG